MGQRIPEATIQEVLARADIVDVIGDYVLLKQSGTNYKGLCPFHNEKTPSFTVSPAKGLFYCFGCHASGNVVRFLMQYESFAFPEALQWLASRYGISIAYESPSSAPAPLNPLYALHRAAVQFFHHYLRRDPGAQAARAYCRQRLISSDLAAQFDIGYAPDAWDVCYRAMRSQGFSTELLLQSGLIVTREARTYDRFRHRIIFAIHDRLGRPIAFGGRTLGGEASIPKYLNSPETPLFHKGHHLYGLHLAKQAIRQREQAIIVEGYTDVLACHRQGIHHAVGTLGTALTEHHAGLLKGHAREVVLVFDSDAAGGMAAERGIGLLLEAGLRVRVAELPEGEDPDSFLSGFSGKEFLQHVNQAMSFLEYLLLRTGRTMDLRTPAGQADCVTRIAPLLRKIDNHVERWGYIAMMAEKTGVPPAVLERELFPRTPGRHGESPSPPTRRIPPRHSIARAPAEEYALIHLLYHDRRWIATVQQQVQTEHFQDMVLGALYQLLLQVAPGEEDDTAWQQQLLATATSEQERLLMKMAVEPLLSDEQERFHDVQRYLAKMRQRSFKTRLHRIKEQLARVHDETEQQRLLQEFDRLGKAMQTEYAQGSP